MRLLRIFAAVLALSAAAVATASAADEKAQVAAAYAAWDAAFNKGDAKAVAAFYADDAKLLPPSHEVIVGPAGVENFFAGLFANGTTDHALEPIEVGGSGDLVFSAAKWSAKGKGSDGSPQDWGGIAVHVFEKAGDGMKLKLHTFN